MKQINNGYKEYYYMLEDGTIYNSAIDKMMYPDKRHMFRLKTIDNNIKRISQRVLYKSVYNRQLCIDRIESLDDEQWKEVQYTNGLYQISSKGRVKSLQGYEAIILKPYTNQSDYQRVDITQYNQRKSVLVHRLVAAAFLPLPESIDMQLHHKDLNKHNNAADNLEWLSPAAHSQKHIEQNKKENC